MIWILVVSLYMRGELFDVSRYEMDSREDCVQVGELTVKSLSGGDGEAKYECVQEPNLETI